MTTDVATSQEVDLYSPLDPAALPDDPVILKQILIQVISLLRKETKRREQVERNLDVLLRKLTSTKSHEPAPGQKVLFDVAALFEEASLPEPRPPTPPQPKSPPRHTPHGRRKPPANVPQVDVIHDLPPELKEQLGADNLIPLADVITFQYDYEPSKLRVLRHIQKKYLRRDLEAQADTPTGEGAAAEVFGTPNSVEPDPTPPAEVAPLSNPSALSAGEPKDTVIPAANGADNKILIARKRLALPSCLAAPGLLAYIWLSKYADHLPLYRLEAITERYGISFSRSTTCDWMMELAEVLHPLWELMVAEVLRSRVIHTDDTTVPLQDPETGMRSTARFWNYLGDEEHALTVFEFTLTHERVNPARFLAKYRGYLQADAYNGYDGLYLEPNGQIIEVGCWQHARKRYKEAALSDLRATCGVAFIKSLYAVEQKIGKLRQSEWIGLTLDERAERIVEIRQRESVPLLKSFRQWIDQMMGQVLPKEKLGDAFRYTLNQWDALNQFTRCGLLDIDNNAAERGHRGIAIGRNNWKFVGSERGGRAAATHFSFIASCKMNGVEPFAYLVDVLNRLPLMSATELPSLLPNRWQPRPAA